MTMTDVRVDAPRDNLIRSVPFEVTRADDDADGLTLEGYAAVFDSPTTIDSWEGQFTESIARGAFSRTIEARTPVLMFNHGQHPLIGDMPIGVIKHLREDGRGLFIRARLAENWLIQPVRDAVRQGAVSGMSFRFSVPKDGDDWSPPADRGGMPHRTLLEVKVPELGPVVFPAYDDTEVGVRSREVLEALQDDTVRTELASALARADTKKPYGDVTYADPGYQKDGKKRYPIDTADHVKAAWSYINQQKNAAQYSSSQVAKIKGRIKAAAKRLGVNISSDSNNSRAAKPTTFVDPPGISGGTDPGKTPGGNDGTPGVTLPTDGTPEPPAVSNDEIEQWNSAADLLGDISSLIDAANDEVDDTDDPEVSDLLNALEQAVLRLAQLLGAPPDRSTSGRPASGIRPGLAASTDSPRHSVSRRQRYRRWQAQNEGIK